LSLEYEYIKRQLHATASVADYGSGSGRMKTVPLLQDDYKTTRHRHQPTVTHKSQSRRKKTQPEKPHNRRIAPEKETFDAIIGADVLHHVEIDRELPKLYRSLKKGGKDRFFRTVGI